MKRPVRFGTIATIAVASALSVAVLPAVATEYHIYPPTSIGSMLPKLQPGDTLIIHSGTYGRVWMANVHGTPDAWITIKGADGEPRPVIVYNYRDKNVIDIAGVTYVKLQHLEIRGGSDGIKFQGAYDNHDIILEDLYIHHVGDTAINASGITELYNLVVRRCEIAYTGGTGEGMYLGKHGAYWNPQVHDAIIEQNYIHHMGGSQGDGIELKHGCYNVVIQDNVIYAQNGYPAITIWGTYKNDPQYNNIVRRNFIYGATDAGIHVTGETTIENNIVVNSVHRGIATRARDYDGKMQYTYVINNTVYAAGGDAVALRNWNLGPGLVFANNAIYQDAPYKQAINAVQGLSAAVVANNIYYGVSNISSPGLIYGDPPTATFVNPSTVPGVMDFYPKPGSMLIDAGDNSLAAADDFNLLVRPASGTAADVGAYEVYGDSNPGWQLDLAIKDVDAAILPGDVNHDGSVNVLDLMLLTEAWATAEGDENYNPGADFNHDGAVNVLDLMMLVNHWGESL